MSTTPERSFPFLRLNERPDKPRTVGLTEIRGPYYTSFGPDHLRDLLESVGPHVDSFKFPGASMPLMSEATLKKFIDVCHDHNVEVSTGGLIEFVLTRGPDAVEQYFQAIARYEFDIVEISVGMLAIAASDYLRLIERGRKAGLKVKAEVGIQFGAGGTSSVEELAAEGTGDPSYAVQRARRAFDAGANLVMLESEGITEQVRAWRTDVPALFIAEFGLESVMFEAADPPVFEWYVKNYGPEVNVFIDHSQVYQLECLRSGIWGTKGLWGRVVSYKG
ncbi:phosphosulfolactate synthase [Micromonospora sp. WMMD1128]|uniref:phosphosulfolactate synthase n=1 Tax=unclassified Micromonospora TaxID=2617518 RepID=UPI00248B7034|nr:MULTISPECIES: phosphosulfolactate synthase [unclassified Micromonospora]WBB75635.1 phosphosulfolactate synthase [Micromonospora sp. WMMD1128]WFE30896.1 phosphosulfolactate synthase [Micromonospora sp. WMMD975]